MKLTADANLDNIKEVLILSSNPYAGATYRLARLELTNGGTATLDFTAPLSSTVLYAACLNAKNECIARPFRPGTDTSVSFIDTFDESDFDEPAGTRSGVADVTTVTQITDQCAEEDNPANGGKVTKSTALFVATDRHEKGNGNNLAAMLRIAVDGSEVILGGDYVGGGGKSNPEFPISDLYDEIDSILAPPYRDVVITFISHNPSGQYDAMTIRRYALTPESTETTFGFTKHPNSCTLPLQH